MIDLRQNGHGLIAARSPGNFEDLVAIGERDPGLLCRCVDCQQPTGSNRLCHGSTTDSGALAFSNDIAKTDSNPPTASSRINRCDGPTIEKSINKYRSGNQVPARSGHSIRLIPSIGSRYCSNP